MVPVGDRPCAFRFAPAQREENVFGYIHSFTVIVADQQRALDFYVDVLGWRKSIDQAMGAEMRFISVAPPEGKTELALGHPSWFENQAAGSARGISLIARDIDETVATLTARGVRFKGPIEDMPWGARATWFYDLDGNEFFLVTE